ncbi:flagellar M-ring protein FliF [bacterium]|nr:flagellar M-ring protein FliF [bacterium]
MAGMFGSFGDRLGTVFANLSIGQKIVLIAVVAGGLLGLYGIVYWAGTPDYVPLFSNLPAEDAGKVVDWLDENGIEYRLEQGGSRVLVSRDSQYEARIQLAQEGLPSKRSTGFEIFDQTNLGMSEFVQKLNFRRALEGELSRTIESLDEIDQARVHIVLPEQALFREKEKEPTASVAMKLRSGLSQPQVQGITHLLASAVEGLEPNRVTIIDARGNILSNMSDRDPLMALSTTQLQLKQTVEQNLTEKVQSMLNQLLGHDKSIVRVSTDLDFTRSETMSELFDPELTAVRSEELNETTRTSEKQEAAGGADSGQSQAGTTDQANESNSVTNYEVSKTISTTTSQSGGIKRITASVIIDGAYEQVEDADGNATMEYRDRTPREMQMITEAVRGALGVNEDRGDEVSVINIAFQAPPSNLIPEDTIWTWLQRFGPDILRNLLLAAAVLGGLFYVRNLLSKSSQAAREVWERRIAALPGGKQSLAALPGAIGEGGEMLALPDIDSELPSEVIEANQLQQQIVDFAGERPEVAARLLKTWLVDEY